MNVLNVTRQTSITKMELVRRLVLLLFKAQHKALKFYAKNHVKWANIITVSTRHVYQDAPAHSLLTLTQVILSFIAKILVIQPTNTSSPMEPASIVARLFLQAAKNLESSSALIHAHHLQPISPSQPMEHA